MEKLPGKGMVTVSSVIMLIWGLINAGYYDVAKLVLADDPSSKAIACGVVVGIASLAAVIGGIFGIDGSNMVAKASAHTCNCERNSITCSRRQQGYWSCHDDSWDHCSICHVHGSIKEQGQIIYDK